MFFALLLELTQQVGHHAQTVRDGRWSAGRDFCYWDFPLVELEGLTMGIVGLGRIGTAVGRLARAFGMKVLAHDALPQEPQEGVRLVSLEELLASSDVVTLHCPLTEQTRELIDARRLAMMKPAAFLINTSRGPVIQERDLAEALNAGRLGGAGLDVLAVEPPPADNPLLRARNCLIAPHIAWATRSARKRLLDIAVANVKAFLEGRPLNVVGG
jgi:glycerate dehydrogenase